MRPLCVAILTALALTGCGGADEVHPKGSTVRVTIDEYRLLPQKVRVTGPRVRLVLRDRGRLTHNVKVFSTTEFDEEDKPVQLGGTPTAHPGETVRASVRLDPGTYRLACSIANHDDLGEHGELMVEKRK